jgi:LysM repeat protein
MSTITMNRQMARPSSGAARVRRRPVRPCPATTETRRPAPVRLTRRGRWVLTVLLLGVVLALSVVFGSGSVASPERGEAPATTTVVVTEGASLWSIADDVAAPGETREVMYEIDQLNQLESSVLVPGQTLVVPAS